MPFAVMIRLRDLSGKNMATRFGINAWAEDQDALQSTINHAADLHNSDDEGRHARTHNHEEAST